jgi:V/A-type H+-transporting ATPase subunit C
MHDSDYIYAVARLRVKEKTLLSDGDVRQMTQMKTVPEICDFLEGRGWAKKDSPAAMLEAEENKLLDLMQELRLDPQFLQILAYPRLFHNLKTGIREVVTEETHEEAFYEIEGFGRSEAVRLLTDKDYDHLPDPLKGVAPQAYELMLKTRDGQALDTLVDRACLCAMEKAGKASKNKLFRQYELLSVALSDIKLAVRAQKMGKPLSFLQQALAPSSLLDTDLLARAAAKSREDLFAYLDKVGFGDAAESLKQSGAAFERWCDNKQIDLLKQEKYDIASVGPVLAYYLARENEIKTARILLTAKANGFDDSVIEERVRAMYV